MDEISVVTRRHDREARRRPSFAQAQAVVQQPVNLGMHGSGTTWELARSSPDGIAARCVELIEWDAGREASAGRFLGSCPVFRPCLFGCYSKTYCLLNTPSIPKLVDVLEHGCAYQGVTN
jgi:hypothetical protein